MTRMQTYSTQVTLLPDSSADRSVQRTIHYLGSKLRAVDPIRRAVSAIAPVGQPVCDLFAGSGIVSLALGSDWDVTSVDIQEYSRVLCNGLTNAPQNASSEGAYLCNRANAGSLRSELRSALVGLLAYEQKSLTEAADGSVESLCDLLEYGSLLPLNASRDMPLTLRTELSVAIDNLDALGLARGPQAVVTRHFGGRYFSWEQAIDLDAMLAEIYSLDHGFRDFYLSAAFVVSSDIVNTVGKHFAQPIKLRDGNGHPKRHLAASIRDRSIKSVGFRARRGLCPAPLRCRDLMFLNSGLRVERARVCGARGPGGQGPEVANRPASRRNRVASGQAEARWMRTRAAFSTTRAPILSSL